MTNIPSNIIAFVLVLGLLVFFHELGHFLFAKLFRVKVYVFSFGFGKRLFGFKRGDTDYRVSAIPLGGYVRMAGETPEDEASGEYGKEFLSKPKWQRFLILFAGPGANVLIAIAFLTWLAMLGIEEYRDERAIIGSVVQGKPAAVAGLQAGDIIVRANGEPVKGWDDLRLLISMNPSRPVKLDLIRGRRNLTSIVTPERVVGDYGVVGQAGVTQYITNEVGRIKPGSAADRAGIRSGDLVVGAGGRPVTQWNDLADVINDFKGRAVPMQLRRGETVLNVTLPPMRSKQEAYPGYIPPTVIKKLPFGDAVRESVDQNMKMLKYTFATLARLFRFEGSVKDFSGPLSIARISGEMLRTGWKEVIFLMASISLQLGIMNLLPIPVLDGGHIFILLIEGAAGRELSDNVKERIQRVGFAVLATLMIVVLCNDVIQNVVMMTRK
jgi:regulator of sigma E protease